MTSASGRQRRGHCQCRYVEFAASGEPTNVHYCHCTMCRRATGGLFATLVWYRDQDINWASHEPLLFRSSDIAGRAFCPRCGSPVYLKYDGSDETALMIGLFEAPAGLRPTHHYGVEARLPWVDIDADLPDQPTSADPRPA